MKGSFPVSFGGICWADLWCPTYCVIRNVRFRSPAGCGLDQDLDDMCIKTSNEVSLACTWWVIRVMIHRMNEHVGEANV